MRLACVLSVLALAGCASITEGTSQTITVTSDPPGATCRLDRKGVQLGTVATTPGTVVVKPKSADDITVTCEKPGFQSASALDKSDTAAATFGNILLGGVIGAVVDQSNGAAYKYDKAVNVTLAPVQTLPEGPPQS